MSREENVRIALQGIVSAVGVFLSWSTLAGLLLYMPPLLSAVWTSAVGIAIVVWASRPNESMGRIQALVAPMTRSALARAFIAGTLAALLSVTMQVWYTAILPYASAPLTEFDLYARRPHGWIAIALFSTLVGPGVEELAFRGRLQPSLIDTMGKYSGVTVCAVAFAAIHGSIEAAPFHFLMGLTYGAAAHVSGSLLLSWAMHVGVNTASYLLTDYYGEAMSPSELPARLGVSPILFIALSVLAATLTIFFLRRQSTTRSHHLRS
jgi:membrane protease YdiL (CAAX protease family)